MNILNAKQTQSYFEIYHGIEYLPYSCIMKYTLYSRCANSNVIPTYKKMTGITLLFGTFLVARGWIYCINTVCNFLPPSVNYLKSTCSNYTNAGLLINYLFILVQHTLHLQTIAFFFLNRSIFIRRQKCRACGFTSQKIKVQMMSEEQLRSASKRADVGMLILSVMTLTGAELHLISLPLSVFLSLDN